MKHNKNEQAMTLLAEKVSEQVNACFENQNMNSDESLEEMEIPFPENFTPFGKKIDDYCSKNDHLPVFSTVWIENPNEEFLQVRYAVISPSKIDYRTDQLIKNYQDDIPVGLTLNIVNEYLTTGRTDYFKITRNSCHKSTTSKNSSNKNKPKN